MEAAALPAYAFAMDVAALRELAPDQEPDVWPEHCDLVISEGSVNYGVSPRDDAIPAPNAHVGAHTSVTGTFWNQPFGGARSLRDLPDVAAVVAFFREEQEQLRS